MHLRHKAGRQPAVLPVPVRLGCGASLRLKGFLVEPVEIETVVADLPGVQMAKAVGVDGEGETRLVLFVTAETGHTLGRRAA